MEELCALRRYIETGDTAAALALFDAMDEMSKEDKLQKIASFIRVLLVHMIKQAKVGLAVSEETNGTYLRSCLAVASGSG